MTEEASAQEIAAAQAYERLHVPALFGQWAPLVLDLAGVRSGDRILDVACGTGVLAREALARHGKTCTIVGVDAGTGMLAVAKSIAPGITWQQAQAESLPPADASFDVVVSQFGVMFFRDRIAAIHEMLRVLAPGGRLAVAAWDALAQCEAYRVLVDLLLERAGAEAANALRAPFVLGDSAELTALFTRAGAGSVAVSTHRGRARFPDVRTMVEAELCGWLPVMGVVLSDDLILEILSDAEQVLAPYRTTRGTVEFDISAHVARLPAGSP